MIKAVEIENFKCIGERQRIEFAPITLLFGPNSAGKSTVIQALIYAYEVLWRNNFDANDTYKGGSLVRLGGFENFVHLRGRNRSISLRFELPYAISIAMLEDDYYDLDGEPFNDYFCLKFGAYTVEMELSWASRLDEPIVSRYEIEFNGIWIGTAEAGPDSGRAVIRRLNLIHPNFLHERRRLTSIVEEINSERDEALRPRIELREFIPEIWAPGYTDEYLSKRPYEGERETRLFVGASPVTMDDLEPSEWKRVSEFASQLERAAGAGVSLSDDGTMSLSIADPAVAFIRPDGPEYDPLGFDEEQWPDFEPGDNEDACVRNSLVDVFLLPLHKLAWELYGLLYVGPMRTIPLRDYVPPETKEEYGYEYENWPDGRGAWASLHHGSDFQIQEVSSWLSRDDRLGTGYGLRKGLAEKTAGGQSGSNSKDKPGCLSTGEDDSGSEHQTEDSRLVFFDYSTRLEMNPEDVGVGLSQLLPVVAAAVSLGSRIVCIEQPELHVHPRVQVNLGDLFIDSFVRKQPHPVLGDCGQCILETHSEHLLLRLLRRVRETSSVDVDQPGYSIHPDQLAINYIEPGPSGMRVRRLLVDDDGDFSEPWPEGFFDERGSELF